jgi:hypothetical protein
MAPAGQHPVAVDQAMAGHVTSHHPLGCSNDVSEGPSIPTVFVGISEEHDVTHEDLHDGVSDSFTEVARASVQTSHQAQKRGIV